MQMHDTLDLATHGAEVRDPQAHRGRYGCSTPQVAALYERVGFRLAGVEADRDRGLPTGRALAEASAQTSAITSA